MTVDGPLKGVTVIDLTRVLAGPYCTLVLADLGARVIKVETPGGGDDSRTFGPFIEGKSAYFMSINRGKESISLNLKEEGDRAVFEDLLAGADVVVENFRAGTMERLGYGWEALHARFPRLIYAACSGFGHTGPYAGRPAYDVVVQAMGGIMSLTGQPGGPPTRVGSSVGDIVAGLFTAIGINGALYRRTMTGEGMKLDVSMLDCQVAILENALARYFASGEVPGPVGDAASLDHAVPGLRDRGRARGHLRRQQRAVRDALYRAGQARARRGRALCRQRRAHRQYRRAGAGIRGDPDGAPDGALAHGAGGGRRAVLADQQGG